jgi:hypothetical protein
MRSRVMVRKVDRLPAHFPIFEDLATPILLMSQTAAAHPAASRRGMRGAAAWKRYYIDLTYSLVEHVCTLSPMQASGY